MIGSNKYSVKIEKFYGLNVKYLFRQSYQETKRNKRKQRN